MAKKGKRWYTIVAPKLFGGVEIGQTIAEDPDLVVGREVNVNLMNLINDYNKFYIKFTFRIVSIDNGTAKTSFVGSQCLSDYISRMVRKYSRRVDTVQDLETRDGVKVRVKGLAIIRGRVKSSIKGNVRNAIMEVVKREVEKHTMDDLIREIISDSIKNKVLREARKVYPVQKFEIRKTEVLSE